MIPEGNALIFKAVPALISSDIVPVADPAEFETLRDMSYEALLSKETIGF